VIGPSGTTWRWLGGAAVLTAVLWSTGTGPVIDGLQALGPAPLALGALIAVPTTLASAWRWHLVARGLGAGIGIGSAVTFYYRAQLLNASLPGGVLGDVHRGLRHGRDIGDRGRGMRAVLWERLAGQLVQGVVAVAVLLVLPSPVERSVPATVILAAAVAAALLVVRLGRSSATSPLGRTLRTVRDDVRRGLLARRTWPGVVLASVAALTGYLATYFVAARAVGVETSPLTLLPLGLLVLVAAALPLNIAGWGPREGMAAWSFGAAGLGADQGVATAVAYGVIVTVASAPGVLVMLLGAGRRRSIAGTEPPPSSTAQVHGEGGARHG
jgi:glycosyltransferase 2 family protein